MNNANPATHIPYGVISMQNIDSDLSQDLWYTHGTDLSYKEALEELRDVIAAEMVDEEASGECPIRSVDEFNDELDDTVECRAEYIQIDEPTIEGEYEGVKYHISWLGGAPLLWVFDSPYVGLYAKCSPCVPGAGDLDSPDPDGQLCYDVPADWRAKE